METRIYVTILAAGEEFFERFSLETIIELLATMKRLSFSTYCTNLSCDCVTYRLVSFFEGINRPQDLFLNVLYIQESCLCDGCYKLKKKFKNELF